MFGRLLCVVGLASLGVLASACTAPADDAATSDDNNLNEAATPRKGSTISSPSVDPNKMYWGARTITYLSQIGYLNGDEVALANRADGILANSPPNGKIGVDELAALESPAHINTLFPAERAIIPKLWKILQIDDATKYMPASATVPTTVHDGYTTAPFQMPINKLSAGIQQIANRIELTQNSDGDATTISGSDVEKAYADKGSYLPGEVNSFRQISLEISNNAPHLTNDAQYVEVNAATESVLLDAPPIKLTGTLGASVSGGFNGSNGASAGSAFQIVASTTLTLSNSDPQTRLIFLDKTSGNDNLLGPQATNVGAETRIEVWKGGVRTAQYDAANATAPATAPLPFGYAVKIGSATYALACNYNGCYYQPFNPTQWSAGMAATSYYVSGQPGYRLDVFQSGRAILVGGGTSTNCLPQLPRSNGWAVPGCDIFSTTGQVTGQVTYGNSQGDSPNLASGSFSVPNFGAAVFYPY